MMKGLHPTNAAIGLAIALAALDRGGAALDLRTNTEALIDAEEFNADMPRGVYHKHARRDPDDIDERLTKREAKLQRRAEAARRAGLIAA